MVTVDQGKVCAKNHPDRLSRLATIHQRYRQTDGRTDGFPVAMAWPNGRPKTVCNYPVMKWIFKAYSKLVFMSSVVD